MDSKKEFLWYAFSLRLPGLPTDPDDLSLFCSWNEEKLSHLLHIQDALVQAAEQITSKIQTLDSTVIDASLQASAAHLADVAGTWLETAARHGVPTNLMLVLASHWAIEPDECPMWLLVDRATLAQDLMKVKAAQRAVSLDIEWHACKLAAAERQLRGSDVQATLGENTTASSSDNSDAELVSFANFPTW